MAVWLPLNGNTNDASGNGRSVTLTGTPSPTTGADGRTNGSHYFNGNDQLMTISGADSIPADTNSFAVSVWARGASPADDYGYIAIRGVNTSIGPSVFWIGTNNGATQYISGAAAGKYLQGFSSITSNPTNWRHIVLVYAGGYQTVYIDGIQRVNSNVGAMTSTTTGTTLTLGGGTAGFRDWAGTLDDFRVYNRAISATEAAALFAAGAQ